MNTFSILSIILGALAWTSITQADGAHMTVDKFKAMDANRDSKISTEENVKGAAMMFKKMDANKDNQVTASEMDSAQLKMKNHKGHKDAGVEKMTSAEKIAMIDGDNDGILSKKESEAGAAKMFSMADTDKDGFLSLSEMQAGHEKKMEDKAKQ